MPGGIRTDSDLAGVVGRSEGQLLEYKRELWLNGDACATDIAGFGNALGGQVLVGVTQASGTSAAEGFFDWLQGGSESQEQQRIQQWLEHHLRPRDFVDKLRYGWLSAPTGSRVLSVEIPPSAVACLAVAVDKGAQRRGTRYVFPVRDDKETRFMDYEEICRRLADPSRAMYLRLRELREQGPPSQFVRLASPLFLLTSAGPRRLIRDPGAAYDASLGELHSDGFTITFSAPYIWGSIHTQELVNRGVLIPYAMVRTLWRDPHGAVCVALHGQVEVSPQAIQVSTS